MIFHSLTYLVFLVIVLATYWSLSLRGQNLFLVIAGYVFYGWEHPWFLLPLWASTVVDYGCARGMERRPHWRRAFLLTSVCGSIALLATFKYANFALDNLDALRYAWRCRSAYPSIPSNPLATSLTCIAERCPQSAIFSVTRSM
jgi:hypothetical protein